MKKIMSFILGLFITVYVLMVVVLTGCLLLYNDYKVTEVDGKSLIIINDNEIKPYKKGDLVIASKSKIEDIKIGDEVLFYSEDYGAISVNQAKVTEYVMEKNKIEGFSVENNKVVSASAIIGKAKDIKIIKEVGGILNVLESRFGFLFIVMMPTLVLFLYIVYRFVIELKNPIIDDEDEDNKTKEKKVSVKTKKEESNDSSDIENL